MQESQAACSFCGKPRHKARHLITRRWRSSTAYICDACLDTCREILHDLEVPRKTRDGVYHLSKQQNVRPPSEALCCSFCGRPQDYVRWLISSPPERIKKYICGRCVGTSLKILQQANDDELRQGWGLARWLTRTLRRRPARLHRLR